jgi:hypothetical protein
MKLSSNRKWRSQVSFVAGLGGLMALVNLAPAQPWSAVGVPAFRWTTVASSGDFKRLVAAGASRLVYGFGVGASPIYVSLDSGFTWIQTSAPSNSWTSVATSADGSRLVAAAAFEFEDTETVIGGNLIYASADSGLTWTPTTAPTNTWMSVASSADGTRLVAAASSIYLDYGDVGQIGDGLIYTSGDSGKTWTTTSAPTNWWVSVASSADGTRLVAVASTDNNGDGMVYRSTNSGITWSAASVPRNRWSSVASSADGVKFVAAAWDDGSTNYNPGHVYISSDSGQTWVQSAAPTNWQSVAASADGTKLIASSYGQIFISTNSGATWENSGTLPLDGHGHLATSADGNRILATDDQLVLVSPYTGPWRTVKAPVNFWYTVAASNDGTTSVAANFDYDGLIYVSSDSGSTWTPTSAPSNSWYSVASSADGTKLVAAAQVHCCGDGLVYISEDSGKSWRPTSAPTNWWSAVATSADAARLVAAGTGAIYTSANRGTDWKQASAPSNNWVSVASSADGMKLIAGSDRVYSSTNGGASWIQTDAPTNYWVSVASSADGIKLAAAGIGLDGIGGIYTSGNSGEHWNLTTVPFEPWTSVACSSDGSKLIAVAQSGQIYGSNDSGVTWNLAEAPVQPWQAVALSGNGSNLVAVSSSFIFVSGPPAALPPPPPRMQIRQSEGGLKVSWLVPSAKFTLQQASDLSNENWRTVSQAPSLNLTNLHYEVVVPSPASNRFYRLKLQ